jgi:hypothetical protein
MKTSDVKRSAVAAAAIVFGLVAPVTYHSIRIYERLRNGPADAAMIISEARTTFYWRFGISTWWAGLIAVVAYRMLLNRPERLVSRSTAMIYCSIALVPLLSWLAYRFP